MSIQIRKQGNQSITIKLKCFFIKSATSDQQQQQTIHDIIIIIIIIIIINITHSSFPKKHA